jgi:hypothetical protein
MQFLLNNLDKVHTDTGGVELYADPEGERNLRVDVRTGRAVLGSHGYEIVLLRNAAGEWVPEHNNWAMLACLLDAPRLATAAFGF